MSLDKLKQTQINRDNILFKIFGSQKVKLYKIKHFIFDFGGVMIENTYVINNLISCIQSDLNVSISRSEDSYYRKIFRKVGAGTISSREFLEKIFDKYYYPFQKNDRALPSKHINVDYYLELWFQLYSKFSHLSSDMESIVKKLHQGGYVVSLMSNSFDVHVRSNELRGFYSIFDNIFLSNEIGFRKPDLEKYKYVIKKLNTKPKKCVFIDDKLSNLIPARQLGMYVIKFESIEKFKEQLLELGIKDLSQLSRDDIKKKYEDYKVVKKEFTKAKKMYKKAKKRYLRSSKKNSAKKKAEFQQNYEVYMKKKADYNKAKEKKMELISRIKIE